MLVIGGCGVGVVVTVACGVSAIDIGCVGCDVGV